MKNLKIVSLLIVLVLALTMLASCASDPVTDDLKSYVNDSMPAVQALYNKALDGYNAVIGGNYTDDATVLAALNDTVVPAISDALETAKAITPATDEVKALNEKYVTALTTYNSTYVTLQEALTEGDAAKVQEAVTLLQTATTQSEDFNTALTSLAEDHAVTITPK